MRVKRLGRSLFVILLLLGCGKTRGPSTALASTPDPGGTADGGGGSDTGTGPVGGDAPVGGDGSVPNLVAPGTLAPGTCGVLRAIQLPSDIEATSAVVTRQAGGFALGPWKVGVPGQIHGQFIDATGRHEAFFSAEGAPNDVSWSVLMADRRLVVDVYVAGADPPLGDDFNTRFWAYANHAATERGTLLSSSWRGTDYIVTQPSLDGKSAVFAIWPIVIAEPQAALIGSDGARVGDAHPLAPPDHRVARCPSVVPTAQGGVVGHVDLDPDGSALRLSWLEADGSLSLNVVWPMPSDNQACPVFSLDDAGLAFLLDHAPRAQPPSFSLYRVGADATVTETPISLASRPLAWTTTSAGVLVLEVGSTGSSLELQTATGPTTFLLAGVSATLRPVYAEAGSIYVDSGAFDEPRVLLELGCR